MASGPPESPAFSRMTDVHNTTDSRIDAEPTTPEPSPSAGWRETAALMHADAGLDECDHPESDKDEFNQQNGTENGSVLVKDQSAEFVTRGVGR